MVFPWLNYQPCLCFPSLALQGSWAQAVSPVGYLRWPQTAAEKVLASRSPQRIPTSHPKVAEQGRGLQSTPWHGVGPAGDARPA